MSQNVLALLDAAVPLWAMQFRSKSLEELQQLAKEQGEVLALCGPAQALAGGPFKPGEAAAGFNALAKAIAILSFWPGGITLFGQHWENQLENYELWEADLPNELDATGNGSVDPEHSGGE